MRQWARLLIVIVAAVFALAGCASHAGNSGGLGNELTANQRVAAQSALDGLQNSNISLQLVAITKWVQSVPTA